MNKASASQSLVQIPIKCRPVGKMNAVFLFLFPLSVAMSLREFVAGGVSGGVGVIVGQPLSLVILRMQTSGIFLISCLTNKLLEFLGYCFIQKIGQDDLIVAQLFLFLFFFFRFFLQQQYVFMHEIDLPY